jgi:cytoskeletal protein RodZ
MSSYRKRSTRRKKKEEATLVGDLFRILFAVSMLVVAILIVFFVFQNIKGFKLPDLKVSAAETTTAAQPVTIRADQETKAKDTERTQPETTVERSTTAAAKETKTEESSEEVSQEETKSETKGPGEEIESKAAKDKETAESKVKETVESYAAESEAVHKNGDVVIGEGPVAGENANAGSSGHDSNISDNGPVTTQP